METLRIARLEDADAIDELMKASIRAIFPNDYDRTQTESAARFVADVDRQLLTDGTYYVVENAGDIVACGGWSRRDKLFTGAGEVDGDARLLDPATEPARIRAMFVRGDHTRRGLGTRILEACEAAARDEGFRRLSLMATLSGVPLYRSYGFEETGEGSFHMPDGVRIEAVAMERPIRPA